MQTSVMQCHRFGDGALTFAQRLVLPCPKLKYVRLDMQDQREYRFRAWEVRHQNRFAMLKELGTRGV